VEQQKLAMMMMKLLKVARSMDDLYPDSPTMASATPRYPDSPIMASATPMFQPLRSLPVQSRESLLKSRESSPTKSSKHQESLLKLRESSSAKSRRGKETRIIHGDLEQL
jgi:hypothetical protein